MARLCIWSDDKGSCPSFNMVSWKLALKNSKSGRKLVFVDKNMQKDCIFLIKVCTRKGHLLHKAQTLPAHKQWRLRKDLMGEVKRKWQKLIKTLLWELKAILECYILAFKTVAVKCKPCFPLPLKLFIFLSTEYSGTGIWVSISLNPPYTETKSPSVGWKQAFWVLYSN